MERAKPKTRQASLLESAEEKADHIDKLVAQAFDSDPKVRLRVAQELSKTDDPRSLFALIELSSDKDPGVKEAAQRALGQFKENKEEEEAIVSLEKIFAETKEAKKPDELPKVRQKMMPTLEKLFAHYEPKKRDSVKRKLLPSLEKLFIFATKPVSESHSAPDPLQEIDKIQEPSASDFKEAEKSERVDLPKNAENFPFGQKQEVPAKQVSLEIGEEEHRLASGQESPSLGEDLDEADKENQQEMESNKLYAIAYKIATTPGFGKAELKREQNRILSNFKKELGLAFKMAEERARQDGLANFNGLKPGMKNLSFCEMEITSISDAEFGSGSRKKPYVKVKITDGHKEQAVLIPPERARGIAVKDKLILKGVSVDFLVESGEVVLIVKPKSKVLLVK
ncbi:MAG: HEAT repeat domain-containing protein [Candidatus Anstonellaceae archaeon]